MSCCDENLPDLCRVLLQHGADPNAKDHAHGNTALHKAVCPDDYIECCKVLVEYQANIHEKTKNGLTPLHKAAASGSLESVYYLLKAGASANERDDEGNTALHKAATCTNDRAASCCRLLVQVGSADPSLRC